jgi:hypothetical protein
MHIQHDQQKLTSHLENSEVAPTYEAMRRDSRKAAMSRIPGFSCITDMVHNAWYRCIALTMLVPKPA